MKNHSQKDVDTYIASSGSEAQPILKELREIIKSTAQEIEEEISYGFPFYKYHGTFAHFAEYKNHVALGFGLDLQKKDREILEKNGYITGQKRIQIKFNQKVPATEIKQILKEQAKINVSKRAKK